MKENPLNIYNTSKESKSNTKVLRKAIIISLFIITIIVMAIFVMQNRQKTKLVPGFPDTPVHSKASLIESHKEPREDILYDATWETDSSVPETSKWYINKLHEEGWTIDIPPADPNAINIQYAVFSKDNYILNISFINNSDNNKTKIVTDYINKNDLLE